ncbi:testis-expressed protein 19 [Herpailurus yagouaroundi]|uniref:testis-expressed protein 19 n=1 Tax=Herpailurus yagouaroundi TaxID=1608482 RepID=UPI001AD7A6AB|nr:testis-expressed protein 19 [Puma yagouaroundi]
MCPPVSVRYGDEGVSYLRASWMYQLRHGDQLGICFACFKAAFLELRDSLESEDWEEGDWDPEPMDPQPPLEARGGPRLRTLAKAPSSVAGASQSGPAPGGAHGVGAGHHAGREPRRGRGRGRGLVKGPAAPLRGGLLRCRLPPEEDAGVGPVESPGKSWKVLLEPDEVWAVGLQDAPRKQDLHRWKLRVLESSPAGQDEELVPADTALLKRGLAILSSSPWAKAGAGEAPPHPASPGPPASSSHGWDPGTAEPGSSGPSGGSLAAVGASALGELARFQPFGRGPQN